jgi:hypothetical protein
MPREDTRILRTVRNDGWELNNHLVILYPQRPVPSGLSTAPTASKVIIGHVNGPRSVVRENSQTCRGAARGRVIGLFRKLPGRHRVPPGRPCKGHVADGVEGSQYRR